MTCRTDPVSDVVNAYVTAMKQAFDPEMDCPPIGGGSVDVRFFAGDGPALATFDAHTANGKNCGVPFLWVRVASRHHAMVAHGRAAAADADPQCGARKAVVIEIGVARCAVVELQPTWDKYAAEAEVSLDDSWRIEGALCMASGILRKLYHTVAPGIITPYGPEGGIIAWYASAHVDLN